MAILYGKPRAPDDIGRHVIIYGIVAGMKGALKIKRPGEGKGDRRAVGLRQTCGRQMLEHSLSL